MNFITALRDPVIISAALLAFISLSFAVFYITRALLNNKKNPYCFIKHAEFLSKLGNNAQDVKITWKGEEISNIAWLKLAFWNHGRKSIRREDISNDFPLSVFCREQVRILDVKELSRSRENIKFESSVKTEENGGNYLEIRIANDEALEKNDGAAYNILFSGNQKAGWTVNARIFDVPKGFKYKNPENGPLSGIIPFLFFLSFGFFSGTLAILAAGGDNFRKAFSITGACASLLFGIALNVYEANRLPKWAKKI